MDLMLKNVRLSFPTLGEPQEYEAGDGKPRWSATFLVEPGSDNDKAIRAAIDAEVLSAFNGDRKKADAFLKEVQGNSNKFAYMDGDTKSYDGYAGMWYLAAHRAANTKTGKQAPPLLLDNNKQPVAADSGRIYAGCYVNAKVSIYVQTQGNKGVRASFSAVQYWGKGDAFSSSAPSADGFDEVTDGVTADDIA